MKTLVAAAEPPERPEPIRASTFTTATGGGSVYISMTPLPAEQEPYRTTAYVNHTLEITDGPHGA